MAEPNRDPLNEEFQYFLENREELLKKFLGRVIIVKNKEVVGDYDTAGEAIRAGNERFGEGNFLVQECADDTYSFTRVFHSRFAPA